MDVDRAASGTPLQPSSSPPSTPSSGQASKQTYQAPLQVKQHNAGEPLRFAHSPYSGIGNQPTAPTLPASENGVKKQTKPRKKKTEDANTGTDEPTSDKPKRPRKPRDPNKPPVQRKKQKANDEPAATVTPPISNTSSALKITDMMSNSEPSKMSGVNGSASAATSSPNSTIVLNTAHDSSTINYSPSTSAVSKPKPASGPYYDPIRGASIGPKPNLSGSSSPSQQAVRPSPSISSLINPPDSKLQQQEKANVPSANPSSSFTTTQSTAASVATSQQSPPGSFHAASGSSAVGDSKSTASSKAKGASPKPNRQKDALPALPMGNGLLSGSTFGQADREQSDFSSVPNQCIIIEVPMTSETGNYVNFMQEVEKKYGFDVAHPRLAEHRRRMKQIAAAGAALESGAASADEMALDVSDMDSNVEMGGVDDEAAPNGAKKKGRRARRGDEYNKDDDFIDDTELMWEEQALASKDGYFVWSGPLIQAGDKPTVERADGTVKRGRGGRGRGSGRGGASRGEGSTRGRGSGGRGSRGGGVRRGRGRGDKADSAIKVETATASAGLATATSN